MSDFSNTAKNLDSGFRLFFSAIQSHEYVGAEKPFRRNDAWQWMIFEACGSRNGREIARNLHGSVKPIFEPYGSLTHSIRFMAEAFGWTEKKVRTFLKNLQNLKMIDVKTTHSINQISICNFDIYQNPSREKGHTAGTQRAHSGHTAGTQRAQTATGKHVNRITGKQKGIFEKYFSSSDFESTYSRFVEVRNSLKKPLENGDVEIFFDELERLSGGDIDTATRILKNSVINQWTGIFPLPHQNGIQKPTQTADERRAEMQRKRDQELDEIIRKAFEDEEAKEQKRKEARNDPF